MAAATTNIIVGAATVSVGDWVTAAGAGSLTDVGYTKGNVTLAESHELYDVEPDQVAGVVKQVPTKSTIQIKVPMLESVLEKYRIATRQPAANLTGTPPDLTLRRGGAAEQYHQLQIATVGHGTTGVRTLTAWRASVAAVEEIAYAKGGEQMVNVTFNLLYDDSVSTGDKFYKIVDA